MSPRALPGFVPTLGGTLLFLSLATLLPLSALLLKTLGLGWAEFWQIVSDPRAMSTYRVTLSAALWATLVDLVLGLVIAWILVRYEFPGRRLLDAAVDLPFALPTAVAGISLVAITAPNGWAGPFLAPLGIKVAYAFPGIVLAMAFTSFPFVVRAVQPVLRDLDPSLEEAAQTLGARPWLAFRKVVLPAILPALVSGSSLALARSLGEFGALVFISGNLPFRTEITSLLIFIRMSEFEYGRAAALASVILAFALALLLSTNLLQAYLHRRAHGRT